MCEMPEETRGVEVEAEGGVKRCSRCQHDKPYSEFYAAKKGKLRLGGYCKQCVHTYKLETDYVARRRATDKAKNLRLKDEFLLAYGGACACCGETEPSFLTVDHINNDGEKHRKSIKPAKRRGGSTAEVYRVLRKEGWPDYVRILCFNCNFGRRGRAECPHKLRVLRAV